MFTLEENRMAVVAIPDDMTKKEWNRIARAIHAQIKKRKVDDKISERRYISGADCRATGLEQLPESVRGL